MVKVTFCLANIVKIIIASKEKVENLLPLWKKYVKEHDIYIVYIIHVDEKCRR